MVERLFSPFVARLLLRQHRPPDLTMLRTQVKQGDRNAHQFRVMTCRGGHLPHLTVGPPLPTQGFVTQIQSRWGTLLRPFEESSTGRDNSREHPPKCREEGQ